MTRFPTTVHENFSLSTARDRLQRSRSRRLVVIDGRRRPVGVLDEPTINAASAAGPSASDRTPIVAFCRDLPAPQVNASDDLVTVARAMLVRGVDAVPVVDQSGRLSGLLTARECARFIDGGTGRRR